MSYSEFIQPDVPEATEDNEPDEESLEDLIRR